MTLVHERYIKPTTDRSLRYIQQAVVTNHCQLITVLWLLSVYEGDSDLLFTRRHYNIQHVIASANHARGYETLELYLTVCLSACPSLCLSAE